MRCFGRGGTTVMLVMLVAASTWAGAEPLCPKHPLRVALYETGFLYFDGQGVDKRMVDELTRRTGCEFEISAPPRARAYAMLESGQIDIVFSALPTPGRVHYAYYVPYMQQRFATIVHRDVPIEKTLLDTFTADTKLRFGVVRGVTYGGVRDAWYADMLAAHRLELGATLPTVFRMLKFKRFDAMFATPLQYEKELADANMRDQVRIVDWFPNEPPPSRNLALAKKNFTQEQFKAWTAVVQSMHADGVIKRILEEYLSAEEASKAVLKPPPRALPLR